MTPGCHSKSCCIKILVNRINCLYRNCCFFELIELIVLIIQLTLPSASAVLCHVKFSGTRPCPLGQLIYRLNVAHWHFMFTTYKIPVHNLTMILWVCNMEVLGYSLSPRYISSLSGISLSRNIACSCKCVNSYCVGTFIRSPFTSHSLVGLIIGSFKSLTSLNTAAAPLDFSLVRQSFSWGLVSPETSSYFRPLA